ncbi:hypothetical protein COW81_02995 [Candidatus Campbellbacteria bacterium CG22_combo_CG10-13_8_21_14_all_36_13]|uniref:VTT domain-containing protein n=1 Tax=Candidatus Campbellbacteria bacterium CG22_combo_CG10-13_8_21_14_all_36_13 TaxID=1974529 RepID=A0A2H0DXN1_9BACT|nr:MAG: hypothetical protein COW81_02995 [Candidatus Campbellbacteria bacterium CG22_combo_CG10-13_8_21_14_all_36_13]
MNKKLKIVLKILSIALLLVAVYYLALFVEQDAVIQKLVADYGYVSLFFISILSGFNLLVPVPAIVFLPIFLSAGLNFWICIIFIVFGMTVGDVAGYVIGRFGKDLITEEKQPKWFLKIEKFINKYPKMVPLVAFFYAGLVPLPNEILVVPLAFFGVKFRYLIISIFLGNLLFNVVSGLSFVSIFGLFKLGV